MNPNPLTENDDWGDGDIGNGNGTGGDTPDEFSPDIWRSGNYYFDGNGYGDSQDGIDGNGFMPGAPDNFGCFFEYHGTLQHSVMLTALLPLIR